MGDIADKGVSNKRIKLIQDVAVGPSFLGADGNTNVRFEPSNESQVMNTRTSKKRTRVDAGSEPEAST